MNPRYDRPAKSKDTTKYSLKTCPVFQAGLATITRRDDKNEYEQARNIQDFGGPSLTMEIHFESERLVHKL